MIDLLGAWPYCLLACRYNGNEDHPHVKMVKSRLAEVEDARDKCEARMMATDNYLSDPELIADVLAFYK